MELYLIRHTTPAVAPGICYGQADLDVTETFLEEASCILQHLPRHISKVFSSPLQRCRRLAEFLFPNRDIYLDDRIKEINCGQWEMNPWDQIEATHLQLWMDNITEAVIPDGESYRQLYHRVVDFYHALPRHEPVAVVTHGGVIRSLLAHINRVQLTHSFDAFRIKYGCTIKISINEGREQHEYLHNPDTGTETHRPQQAQVNNTAI